MADHYWLSKWRGHCASCTWQRAILHEAGHMSYLNLTHPEIKAYYAKSEPSLRPPYLYVTAQHLPPHEEIKLSMAGEMAVEISRDVDYDSVSLLYEAYERGWGVSVGSDWHRLHNLLDPMQTSDLYLRSSLCELRDLLCDNWDLVIDNYRIADVFFNCFNRIPDLLKMLDDPEKAYKILGDDTAEAENVKEALLDPDIAFQICENLGTKNLTKFFPHLS